MPKMVDSAIFFLKPNPTPLEFPDSRPLLPAAEGLGGPTLVKKGAGSNSQLVKGWGVQPLSSLVKTAAVDFGQTQGRLNFQIFGHCCQLLQVVTRRGPAPSWGGGGGRGRCNPCQKGPLPREGLGGGGGGGGCGTPGLSRTQGGGGCKKGCAGKHVGFWSILVYTGIYTTP